MASAQSPYYEVGQRYRSLRKGPGSSKDYEIVRKFKNVVWVRLVRSTGELDDRIQKGIPPEVLIKSEHAAAYWKAHAQEEDGVYYDLDHKTRTSRMSCASLLNAFRILGSDEQPHLWNVTKYQQGVRDEDGLPTILGQINGEEFLHDPTEIEYAEYYG